MQYGEVAMEKPGEAPNLNKFENIINKKSYEE